MGGALGMGGGGGGGGPSSLMAAEEAFQQALQRLEYERSKEAARSQCSSVQLTQEQLMGMQQQVYLSLSLSLFCMRRRAA